MTTLSYCASLLLVHFLFYNGPGLQAGFLTQGDQYD
jgi:hypothetical protein